MMKKLNNNQNEEFYIKLFKSLSLNENIIFSPLSLYASLSMATLGSKGNT